MNILLKLRAPLAVLLCVALISCGTSGLITALDVAEVAANSAIPIIQAFSVQLGPTAALATAYAKGISQACEQSVTELGSTDSKAVQDTKIAGYFAEVAAVSLPAGTVAEVLAVISAVGSAVQIILTQINAPTSPTPAAMASPEGKALLAKYQTQVKALGSDKARIQDVLTRAQTVKRQ
jgi:hypothetical protein